MATKCLSVSEHFSASLTDEFAIAFLFNYLSLCHLRLLISLLHIAFDRSFVDYFFARWAMFSKGSLRRGNGLFACFWVFAQSSWVFVLIRRLLFSLVKSVFLRWRFRDVLLHDFRRVQTLLLDWNWLGHFVIGHAHFGSFVHRWLCWGGRRSIYNRFTLHLVVLKILGRLLGILFDVLFRFFLKVRSF